MKRMLLSGTAALMAAAAFAAPAQASDTTEAVCGQGVPQCVVDAVNNVVEVDIATPCGKPLTECVRDAANTVIDIVNSVGPIIGDLCEDVFPNCGDPDTLLPVSLSPIGG